MLLLRLLLSLLLLQHAPARAAVLQQQTLLTLTNNPHDYSRIHTLNASIPIDHFNSTNTNTYHNRYWLNSTFYAPYGPIFFYDAGERGVSTGQVSNLFSPFHSLMVLARKFNGLVVVWEHRFFGGSLPFPLRLDSSHEEQQNAYRYLDTEQALEDVVYFATHFSPPGLQHHWDDLKPDRAPWIWIGASYPGTRAAMIRKRNPDIFFASWASSANIQVVLDFPEYYLQISQDLPPQCGNVIRTGVRYADDILVNGSTAAKLRLRAAMARRWTDQSLWAKLSFILFAPDFAIAARFPGVISRDWQLSGLKGFMSTICTSLEHIIPANSSGEPINPHAALTAVLDAIALNEAHFSREINSPEERLDQRSWQYMTCIEYPNFRTSAPHSHLNILPSQLTLANSWKYACALQFPWLEYPPNVSMPMKYAGWNMSVSNTMWTNGLKDPWHQLGMQPRGSFVPGAPVNRSTTDKVPGCGVVNGEGEMFGLVREEGFHAGDIGSVEQKEEAREATGLFGRALEVWLKCFYDRVG